MTRKRKFLNSEPIGKCSFLAPNSDKHAIEAIALERGEEVSDTYRDALKHYIREYG